MRVLRRGVVVSVKHDGRWHYGAIDRAYPDPRGTEYSTYAVRLTSGRTVTARSVYPRTTTRDNWTTV